MHVPFKIHYRNNLIDKKHSYLIPHPPSWDDRNCSYCHQIYPSALWYLQAFNMCIRCKTWKGAMDLAFISVLSLIHSTLYFNSLH